MLLVLLALFATVYSQSVIAKKEFVSERNGLYTIRVSYKKGSSASVSDVRIKDTLPEYLDLVSGQLSTTGPNPGKDFHHIDYVVRVVDYEFSLQNRTAEFNLPAATLSFNKEDGSEGTIRTNALPLKVSGPVIPSGDIDQPLVIFALTIVLPLLGAYFGIQFFHQKAAASGVSGKKKRN